MDSILNGELEDINVPDDKQEYKERIRGLLKENFERIKEEDLLVCILGPVKGAGFAYKKRKDIKESLEDRLNCSCIFLEDELSLARGKLPNGNLKIEETIILSNDDIELIIALDISQGVMGEIHDFAQHDFLARKMLLLIPEWYKNGYHAKAILRDTIAEKHNFTQEEYEKCCIVSKCLERALVEKEKKILRKLLNNRQLSF